MQLCIVRERCREPVEDGDAPGPVRLGARRAAVGLLAPGRRRTDFPLRQRSLVLGNRVERVRQLAIGGGAIALGERGLGEHPPAEAEVGALTRHPRQPARPLRGGLPS